jgi:hypothetical protein
VVADFKRGYVVMVAKLGLEPSGRKSVWVQIPLSAPKKENKMRNGNKIKYRLEGLNILVRNDQESKFVVNLAWNYGYRWRNKKDNTRVYGKPTISIYRRQRGKDGSFIYCFDYEQELEEFKLSFFSLIDYDEFDKIETLTEKIGLKVYHASELMQMRKESLDLLLRLRN